MNPILAELLTEAGRHLLRLIIDRVRAYNPKSGITPEGYGAGLVLDLKKDFPRLTTSALNTVRELTVQMLKGGVVDPVELETRLSAILYMLKLFTDEQTRGKDFGEQFGEILAQRLGESRVETIQTTLETFQSRLALDHGITAG